MGDIRSTKKEYRKDITIRVIISFILIGFMFAAGLWFAKTGKEQRLQLLRQSVKRTIVECYAIEGEYPEDIAYLEENYGLKYDHKKYYLHYDFTAANMMPNVEVYEKE